MSLIDGAAKAKTGCTLGGCFAFSVFVIFCVALTVGFMGGPGSSADQATTTATNSTSTATACGQKGTMLKAPLLPSSKCDVNMGASHTTTLKSSNLFYRRTAFGCSGPKSGWDPPSADNCQPTCGETIKSLTFTDGTVVKVSKDYNRGDYESTVKYYAANMDQFSCGGRLKVTNVLNGRAVVVVVIDRGPGCFGAYQTTKGLTIDLSYPAGTYLGSANYLKVEAVSRNTPVGPLKTCTASLTGHIACALGVEGSLPAVDNALEGINSTIKS